MSLYDPEYVKSIVKYTNGGIPKIIHQIWISENGKKIPTHWEISPIEWKKYHGKNEDYIYILWDADNSKQFIKTYYPELLEIYTNFKYVVNRCDMMKACFLYKYGGIYSDMDNYPLENIEKYLDKDCDTYLTKYKIMDNQIIINNNLIFTKPERELFLTVLEDYKNNSKKYYMTKYLEISALGYGPYNLYIDNSKYKIHALPYEQFNPYSFIDNYSEKRTNVVIMSVPGGSWFDDETKAAKLFLQNWVLFLILFILVIVFIIIITLIYIYNPNKNYSSKSIIQTIKNNI